MASKYLKVIAENIPVELKELKQWVVWETRKPDTKGGKEKKVPFSEYYNKDTNVLMYAEASISDPETWMTFEDALKCLKKHRSAKGLNFALTEESGIVGIDIDHAIDAEGNRDENKFNEIKNLKTYAELSPSGKGLRAFCFGTFPDGEEIHKGDFETYKKNHFLSVTGHKLEDAPSTVNNVQEALNEFRARYFKQAITQIESKLPVTPVELTDQEIIDRLANSKTLSTAAKFRKLFFNGDIKEYGNDHSSADMALVSELIFYTQKEEQIDRLFRQSKLFRPEKWDRNAGYLDGENVTYGQRTIRVGLRNRKDVFKGDAKESEVYVDLFPYKITSEGIFKKVPSKDNPQEVNDVRISSTPCKIIAIGDNVDTGEILYKICITDAKKREKIYWKSGEDLLTRTGALSLIKDGMLFKESVVLDIENLFDIYIHAINGKLPEELTASKSGWKKDFSIFVVGNYGYSQDGVTPILQMENSTAELYAQKGTLEGWKVAADILLEYDAVRFKFYASCTPMLLSLLNVSSFLQEQCAPSGLLKTLTGWFCASIWGNPVPLQINASSTPKGIEAFVGFNTDLPIYIDETSTNEKEIKDLIYTIANGVGRSTSNKSRGYEMPKTWSTVVLTTGENPILPTNAKMGQLVRNVPLKGGVDTKLDQEIVATAESAIMENYGHFRELYIQKVFKYKSELKKIYTAFRNEFPKTEDITSERAKKFYAAIATAGLLVEEVFKDIGIATKDPFEIVNHYFEVNVISSTVFVPDYIRALEAVYSWFDANRIYFEDPVENANGEKKEINHERYGWIRDNCICFIPIKIEEFVTKSGYNYLGCLEEWKNNGIIATRAKKNESGSISILPKVQLKVDGHVIQVIKIPMRKDDENEDLKEKDDRDNKNDGGMKKRTAKKSPTANIMKSLEAFCSKASNITTVKKSSLVVSPSEMAAFMMEDECC